MILYSFIIISMTDRINELINSVKEYIQDEPKQKENSIKTI